jgi:hypothetical protein
MLPGVRHMPGVEWREYASSRSGKDLAVWQRVPRPVLVVLVLALAGLALAALAVLRADLSSSQAYSVATVRDMFTHAPKPWVGRTLAVRGRLAECTSALPLCPPWQWRLFDVNPRAHISIPVEPVPPDAPLALLLARMRSLPMLGALVPVPHPKLGELATYQVRLTALPARHCSNLSCATGDGFDLFGDDYYLVTCDTDTCYKMLLLADGL